MYLLLGDPHDLCCVSVRNALEARGHRVFNLANPVLHPARFEWRLSNDDSTSRLAWNDGSTVTNDDIAGVLVRNIGWIDSAGWEPADLAYMQTEMQAALLAWLWSLPCPVINRYSAVIWYSPQAPLLSWHKLLRHCGLPTLETTVTNEAQEARAFQRRLAAEGVAGAVYGPLTSEARYLIASEEDWRGVASLQQVAPVILAVPHGEAEVVCVVGERVVWAGAPSAEMIRLEPGLRTFAAAAGLAWVELDLAPTMNGICVIGVEPHPNLDRFGDRARQQIVEGIVSLLADETANRCQAAAQVPQGRFV